MSIILKGIDLPKKGEWLEVIIKPTKEVIIDTIRYRDNALLKTEYDSAIQIPKGHRRLIDGDKLRATLRRWTEDEWNQKASPVSWAYAYEDLIDLIDDAPTILEAEET